MDSAIQELLNKLSDDVKNILIVKNPDGSEKIDYSKLSKALSYAGNLQERDAIVELFLRQSINTDAKWNRIDFSVIEPYKDVLIKLCDELGLKETGNPFLVFLPKLYQKDSNIKLTRDNLIDLNNLYANNKISKEDLMGKGPDGENNILFNSNLYSFYDADIMYEYWKWLKDPENLKKLNWVEIRDANLSNNINKAADKANSQIGTRKLSMQDWAEVFNNIYFKNPETGEINAKDTLDKFLQAGSINMQQTKNKSRQRSKTKVGTGQYNQLKKDLRNSILTTYRNLSPDELHEIFTDLLNEIGY